MKFPLPGVGDENCLEKGVLLISSVGGWIFSGITQFDSHDLGDVVLVFQLYNSCTNAITSCWQHLEVVAIRWTGLGKHHTQIHHSTLTGHVSRPCPHRSEHLCRILSANKNG